MIDVRWPQHRYARRVGWAGQRLPALPRLLARARVDGGGAGSLAGDFEFRRAASLAGADAVGGGVDFGAAVPAAPAAPAAGSVALGERLVSRAVRPAGVIDVAQATAEHARLSSGASRDEPLLASLHARSGTATADLARGPGAPPPIAAGEAAVPVTPPGERDQGVKIRSSASAVPQRELLATAGDLGLSGQRVVRRGTTSFSGLRAASDQPPGAAGKPERAHSDSGSGAEMAVDDTRPLARPAALAIRVAEQGTSAAASVAATRAAVDREQLQPDVPPASPEETKIPVARGEPRREVAPASPARDARIPGADVALAGEMRSVVLPVATGVRRAFDGAGTSAAGGGSLDTTKDAAASRSLAPGLPSGVPVVGEHPGAKSELAPMSAPVATARERDLPAAGNGVTAGLSPRALASESGELHPVVPTAPPGLPAGPGPLAGRMRVRRPARSPGGPTGVDRRPLDAGSQVSPGPSRAEETRTGMMSGIPTLVMAGVRTGESVAHATLLPQDTPATVSAATPAWPVRRSSLAAMRSSARTSSPVGADRASASSGAGHFGQAATPSAASLAAPDTDGSRSPLPIAVAGGRPPTIDSVRTAGQVISPGAAGGQPLLSRLAGSERQSGSATGGATLPPLAGGASITAFRRAAGHSPALLAPEIVAPASGDSGAFVWRRPAAPVPPGAGGRTDVAARVASDTRAAGLARDASGTADADWPASTPAQRADRHSADVDPAPAGTGSAPSGEVDWEQLVSEVSRRIRQQLMVERERRGLKRWN